MAFSFDALSLQVTIFTAHLIPETHFMVSKPLSFCSSSWTRPDPSPLLQPDASALMPREQTQFSPPFLPSSQESGLQLRQSR